MVVLSKRQREVLEKLNKGEEDLIYADGQVYVGLERSNVKLLYSLLRLCLIIKNNDGSSRNEFEGYYEISESGKRLLAGDKKIYRASNGKYYESLMEIPHD